jgi:hypothetical protein
MSAPRQDELMALFTRVTIAAQNDPDYADQVRDLLAQSGLLEVFGAGATVDVVDLLDSGGEDALRVRLHQLTLAELRQVVASNEYDPEKESARWRSPAKYIDLIVRKAKAQLEAELAAQANSNSGAGWML